MLWQILQIRHNATQAWCRRLQGECRIRDVWTLESSVHILYQCHHLAAFNLYLLINSWKAHASSRYPTSSSFTQIVLIYTHKTPIVQIGRRKIYGEGTYLKSCGLKSSVCVCFKATKVMPSSFWNLFLITAFNVITGLWQKNWGASFNHSLSNWTCADRFYKLGVIQHKHWVLGCIGKVEFQMYEPLRAVCILCHCRHLFAFNLHLLLIYSCIAHAGICTNCVNLYS